MQRAQRKNKTKHECKLFKSRSLFFLCGECSYAASLENVYAVSMKSLLRFLLFATLVTPSAAFSQDFRISISVSPFTEVLFHAGITFSDGKVTARTPEELQRLFADHGANEVFARISTTRKHGMGFGDHSMEKGLERARMAKALNLPLNPELGLWDSYGDVRCQPSPDFRDFPEIKLPGAWTS